MTDTGEVFDCGCKNGGYCTEEVQVCICPGGYTGLFCQNRQLYEWPPLKLLLGFMVISVASYTLGKYVKWIRLPLITGYLLVGILSGPAVLNLIPEDEIRVLNFVDDVSLAVIAFAAGTKLFVKDYRHRIKSMTTITAGLVAVEYLFGTIVVFLISLTGLVPFMNSFSTSEKWIVSLLASTLMVARSPATIIAIVDELRARGPFTSLAMGVTIVTDMIVIVLFAIAQLLTDATFNNSGLETFLYSIGRIIISLLVGWILGTYILPTVLYKWDENITKDTNLKLYSLQSLQIFIFLMICFMLSMADQLDKLMIDSLIVLMIAGFCISNYTEYRQRSIHLLHTISPIIYIGFFTLTGAALALDELGEAIALSLVLIISRALSIFIGSYVGARIANEPDHIAKYSWMTYITQAGVTLGLAKRVHLFFPSWGGEFATIIVSVVIFNQLAGPPLCRYVIKKIGEAHVREVVLKGKTVVLTDISDENIKLQKELQGFANIVKYSDWECQIYLWWKLVEENNTNAVNTIISQLLMNNDNTVHFAYTTNDDNVGYYHDKHKKFINDQSIPLDTLDDDDDVLMNEERPSTANNQDVAAEEEVMNEQQQAILDHYIDIDVLVLLLSDDNLIHQICKYMATNHPQIKLIIRLLSTSQLVLANRNTNLDQDNKYLPHYVDLVYPSLATAQLMVEMMLTPANRYYSISKNEELSLAKKIALGHFGTLEHVQSPQRKLTQALKKDNQLHLYYINQMMMSLMK